MGRFNNVTLGEYYMQDLGLALASKKIGLPSVQTKYVAIPLRDGDLDFTNVLSDKAHYGNRDISMNMNSPLPFPTNVMSNVANRLHGQKVHITFDDDAWYYYIGRLDMKSFTENRKGGEYEIEANCEPFKYCIQTSAEDWLWDSFDFEDGYINEFNNVSISGSETLILIADEQISYATITTDAAITLTFGSKTVNVSAGTSTLYDFEFVPGENEITITGTATVTITYRGKRL